MQSALIAINTIACADTTNVVRSLLHLAEGGALTGLAFVGILRQRKFVIEAIGEAHRNPTFTRGALLALDDQLSEIEHRRAVFRTTM